MAVVIGTVITLLLSLKFALRSRSSKLPPLAETGMFEMIGILSGGTGAPDYYQATMKKKGLVYRLPLPEMSPWIVVCDPVLARRILVEEEEKPSLYHRYSGLSNGVTNVHTAHTRSHSWQTARKGLAPSFNLTNICASMPKMYEKIDDLKCVLARHESEKTTFDLPELMTELAMDFLCAGKSSKANMRDTSLMLNPQKCDKFYARSDVWC